MRELVYLSERKLQQFQAGQPQRWLGRLHVEGEMKVPGFGGLKVSPAGGAKRPAADLDKVLAALEKSDRASRWFTDDVQPGEWVQFEAPLSHVTLEETVIFLDVDRPTVGYPHGGENRLMLYGSRDHLVGADLPPSVSVGQMSREMSRDLAISAQPVSEILRSLQAHLVDGGEGEQLGLPRQLAVFDTRVGVSVIVSALDKLLALPHTAAWMAGYARVTAVWPDREARWLLFATPLYVEYVAAPPTE